MIRFWELARCVGVDERATPHPGMVVPLGGSNVVLLDTDGKDLKVAPDQGGIEIETFDAKDLQQKLREENVELSQPGVDPQYKEAMMPTSMFMNHAPRFLRIHGKKHKIGFPGALVQARSARRVEAALNVVVLGPMTVKIGIRNVKVRDAQNNIVFHAKRPCDPEKECVGMNAVWTPQTNMTFELIPSEPAFIDVGDAATRVAMGKGFGLKDPDTAVFPPVVDPGKLLDVFAKYKVAGADVTLFVVDRLAGGPNGVTYPQGMIFIASTHGPTTFAHEAGHYLGGKVFKGKWKDHGHTFDPDKDQDLRMLMRDNGAGWKIPFELVSVFRGYFERHAGH